MTKLTLQDLRPHSIMVELKHPVTDEALGVSLEILGTESREYIEKGIELYTSRGLDTEIDLKRLAFESNSLFATSVIGWDDDEFFGGKFCSKRINEIANNPEFKWLREQVEGAQSKQSSFFA